MPYLLRTHGALHNEHIGLSARALGGQLFRVSPDGHFRFTIAFAVFIPWLDVLEDANRPEAGSPDCFYASDDSRGSAEETLHAGNRKTPWRLSVERNLAG
jgi:hypothetical protein